MSHDQVLDMMKYLGMSNSAESKVKVIFVPCYLDGKDGILNLEYYDLVLGNDLSVYPSYYEPWGYTPLESVAFHVPVVIPPLFQRKLPVFYYYLQANHYLCDRISCLTSNT